MRAVFTFRHQTVIDPRTLATVPLMPYTSAVAAMDKTFLGPLLPSEVAAQVATGQVHPTTHLPLLGGSAEVMEEEGSEQRSLVEEAVERPEAPSVRFSSPFISVSFRALIEKPSERGLATESDLSQLDNRIKRMAGSVTTPVKSSMGSASSSMISSMTPSMTTPLPMNTSKREYRSVVAESPPRKRITSNRVEESPVINRNSFLDRFRNTVVRNSIVC